MNDAKPDWEQIAKSLGKKVVFALNHLAPRGGGSGLIMYLESGETRHWREDFADALELMPGVKVDRAVMHALDFPKKERVKFFKNRRVQKGKDA